ncbi:DNA polymerase III subunit gamma/tau [Alphaproteobacteria bacterium]|nr:DNA polymerase III subunit gamma/tau [Alphaproteobacteria bacterium]
MAWPQSLFPFSGFGLAEDGASLITPIATDPTGHKSSRGQEQEIGVYQPMTDTAKPAYRVLARKYRPDTFSELIGQDALVRTLGNALSLGRLAHAFVLTGVRGIGKTSTARVLAKGLNCIGADGTGDATLEPCGQCEPCKSIAAGRHVDVLEIDAASHTGVDDAREIIEGVGYRPVSARYKIYIIDEVHMMSKSAFNALLKTLEEPPDAVKFIFATTEIRKVPVTILSRCQRYDLRRVPAAMLAGHLGMICQRESIAADEDALASIARAAEGSVRDALSLLDQAAAMTADKLTNDMVADMLGRPGRRESQTVLTAALAGDAPSALAAFNIAYSRGAEPEMLVTDLLDLIHLASMQAAGGSDDALIESERDMIAGLAESGIARLGRAWQLLLKGHGELGQAPNPAAACEMLIIRLAHTAHMPTPGELMQKLPKTSPSSPPSASSAPAASVPVTSAPVASSVETAPIETGPIETAPIDTGAIDTGVGMPSSLAEIVALAETNGEMLLAARIRNHVKLVSLKPGNLQIGLVGAAPDQLAGDIARYLSQWTGQRWLVSLSESGGSQTLAEEQHDADEKLRDTITSEPLVAQILDIFPGASIDEIKNPEPPDAAVTLVDDNGLLAAGQNNDDEEMSG